MKKSLQSPLSEKLLLGLVLVITFLTFKVALDNSFVTWDDPRYVLENPIMQTKGLEGFLLCLKSVVMLNYHPVTILSLWLNVQLFGLQAEPIILTNILLHCFNVWLIFKLSEELKPNFYISLLIALFWAIHPMHTEAIVWVSARKELLYTFFFLFSSISYLKYLKLNTKRYLLLAFLFFFISCLSKASAVVLPICFLMYEYLIRNKIEYNIEKIKNLLPFFLLSILTFLVAIITLSNGNLFGILNKNEQTISVIGNSRTQFEQVIYSFLGLFIYLFKFIFPVNLHHWYVYPQYSKVFLIMIPFFIIIVYFTFKSKSKIVKFGSAFFFINILLVLQFVPNSVVFMAERYTYLSYFGLLFIVFHLISNSKFVSLSFFLVPFYIYLCYQHSNSWKNDYTLWKQTYRQYPSNYGVAKSFLSQVQKRNDDNEISEVIDNSIKEGLIDPEFYFQKSQLQIKAKKPVEALGSLNKTIASLNSNPEFKQNNLSVVFLSKVVVFEMLGKNDSAQFNMIKAQKILKTKVSN